MAKETLISHTHRLIPFRPSPTTSIPNSDELLYQTPKTPRLLELESSESVSSLISANVIAENEDLLTLILVWLPAKSLLSFQSVSRKWRSIISDPTFRRLRFRGYNTGAQFLFRQGKDGKPELNFISPRESYVNSMGKIASQLKEDSFDASKMLGFHSCNGLVAFALKPDDSFYVNFFVYNPTTGSHRLLPRLYARDYFYQYIYHDPVTNEAIYPVVCPQTVREFVSLSIAYDPLKSDRYRVVCLWSDFFGFRVAIYASETEDWRDTSCSFDFNIEFIHWKGVLWNGDLHWVSSWWFSVCLDIENGVEKVIMARLPDVVVSSPEDTEAQVYWPELFFFGLCGGDLCLVRLKEPKSLLFDVLALESDYSRWNVKYCLDLSPVTTLYPSMAVEEGDPYNEWFRCRFSILSCSVDAKGRQPDLLISFSSKIISCDMNEMIVKELADVVPADSLAPGDREEMCKFRWSDAFEHVESFASV